MESLTPKSIVIEDDDVEPVKSGELINHLWNQQESMIRLLAPAAIESHLEKPPRFVVYLECSHFALADELNGEDNGFCGHDPDELGFQLCECHAPPHLPGRYYHRVECENQSARPVLGSAQTRLRLCCRCADELEGMKLDRARERYGLGKYDRPSTVAMREAERHIVARVLAALHREGERPPVERNRSAMFAQGGAR